jgi:hypothetical protein
VLPKVVKKALPLRELPPSEHHTTPVLSLSKDELHSPTPWFDKLTTGRRKLTQQNN